MSKKFFFMLKGMGKKGAFGRRFIDSHAHKDEKGLREEIFRELNKTLRKEIKEKRLENFRDQLNRHPQYDDFRRSEHYEKVMGVSEGVLNDIRRSSAEAVGGIKKVEEEGEEELKKLASQIYNALRGRVDIKKINEEIRRQKTEDRTWMDAARAANNGIIKELREQLKTEKEGHEEEGHWTKRYTKKALKGIGKVLWWTTKWGALKPAWGAMKTGGKAAVAGGEKFIENWNPNFFIILAIIIYLMDMNLFGLGTSFNGVRVEHIGWNVLKDMLTNWPKIFLNSVVLVCIAFYWIAFGPSWREFISFGVMAMTTSFLISFGALSNIPHLILVYFLYLGFIGPVVAAQSGSRSRAHYLMALFLFIDYFGYGLLEQYVFNGKDAFLSNRFIYPIWFYFTAFYAFRVKSTTFTKVVVFLVITINILAFANGFYEVRKQLDTPIR